MFSSQYRFLYMCLFQILCIFWFLKFLILEEQRQRLDFSVAALR